MFYIKIIIQKCEQVFSLITNEMTEMSGTFALILWNDV